MTAADNPSYVEWTCVDALHVHDGQPKAIEVEWLGTKVKWSINENATGTTIELEHEGLTPALLCYEICRAGWDLFFLDSLKAYLESGEGKPHKP